MTYQPTPINAWGSDHWSTLAYIETRLVDYSGQLDRHHLRGNTTTPYGTSLGNGDDYPTRLVDEAERWSHNDFDCIADMIAHGLLTCDDHVLAEPPYAGRPYRRMYRLVADKKITFELTGLGLDVCASLRAHKASGKNFASFRSPKNAAFRARAQLATASDA